MALRGFGAIAFISDSPNNERRQTNIQACLHHWWEYNLPCWPTFYFSIGPQPSSCRGDTEFASCHSPTYLLRCNSDYQHAYPPHCECVCAGSQSSSNISNKQCPVSLCASTEPLFVNNTLLHRVSHYPPLTNFTLNIIRFEETILRYPDVNTGSCWTIVKIFSGSEQESRSFASSKM